MICAVAENGCILGTFGCPGSRADLFVRAEYMYAMIVCWVAVVITPLSYPQCYQAQSTSMLCLPWCRCVPHTKLLLCVPTTRRPIACVPLSSWCCPTHVLCLCGCACLISMAVPEFSGEVRVLLQVAQATPAGCVGVCVGFDYILSFFACPLRALPLVCAAMSVVLHGARCRLAGCTCDRVSHLLGQGHWYAAAHPAVYCTPCAVFATAQSCSLQVRKRKLAKACFLCLGVEVHGG
jgi:hypothetical protein